MRSKSNFMDVQNGISSGGFAIDDSFLRMIKALHDDISRKIKSDQSGVPTFFDNAVLGSLDRILQEYQTAQGSSAELEHILALVHRYSEFKDRQRFASYSQRAEETRVWKKTPWEPEMSQMAASQGVSECLRWRNRPVFKTVFDFALYPMLLFDVKPACVFELGSGAGGSAIWLADLLQMFGLNSRIYSIDLHKPPVQDSRIEFVEDDVQNIEALGRRLGFERLAHPWVVIEDVHANTLGIMRDFWKYMACGDYLIIEDSVDKQPAIEMFSREAGRQMRIDSRYTDWFGRNATCCIDSIITKF